MPKLTKDEELVLKTYRDLRDNNELDQEFVEDEQRIIDIPGDLSLSLTLSRAGADRVEVPADEIGEGCRGEEAD